MVVIIIVSALGVLLLALTLIFVFYIFALKAFHQIFDRPFPRPPYDKSPLSIKQDTLLGRGKNWFYSNRMDFMDVQITAYDGIKLSAYYRPADDSATKKLVILIHGWRDHPSDMGAYAHYFLLQGDCHVLIPHLRAHGMSQGRFIGYGLFDSQDIIMWTDYLEKRLGEGVKTLLVGRSMGATTALMAAGSRRLSKCVVGIVADCPFDSLEKQILHVLHIRYKLRGKWMMKAISRIAASRIGFPVKRASVLPIASRIRVPVLIFHGTEDRFVPIEMSESIYDRLVGPKRFVVIEGARHLMSFDRATERYCSEVYKLMKASGFLE